jgi:hypothetical protein
VQRMSGPDRASAGNENASSRNAKLLDSRSTGPESRLPGLRASTMKRAEDVRAPVAG